MYKSGSNFGVCDHSNKVLEGHRLLWSVLYLSRLKLYSPHRLLTFICQTNKLRSLSPTTENLSFQQFALVCNKDFTYFKYFKDF